MKIRGKKEDEKIDVEDQESEDPTSLKLRGTKKKTEIEGSRWAAFFLLIITLVVGVGFYIQGLGGWSGLVRGIGAFVKNIGGQSTYVIDN